jgi:hypothetical protein
VAHGGGWDPSLGGGHLADQPLATQGLDAVDHGLQRRSVPPLGPRVAVLLVGPAIAAVVDNPLAHPARENAYGFTGSLRRLSTQNHFGQALSTERRQPGILVDVYSAPPRDYCSLDDLSFLGPSRMDNLLKAHS